MNFEQAWKFLEEKGLSIGEKMNVRNAFYKAAKQLSNVTKKDNYFENREISGFVFSTEKEAEFVEHLFKYLSDFDTSKIMDVLKIINSLSGIKSDWKF